MDDYQRLFAMKTDMDARVADWNRQFTEATQKKDQKKIEAVQRDYEAAEKAMVSTR